MSYLQKAFVACVLVGGGFFLGHVTVPKVEAQTSLNSNVGPIVVTSSADGKTIYFWHQSRGSRSADLPPIPIPALPGYLGTAKVP